MQTFDIRVMRSQSVKSDIAEEFNVGDKLNETVNDI